MPTRFVTANYDTGRAASARRRRSRRATTARGTPLNQRRFSTMPSSTSASAVRDAAERVNRSAMAEDEGRRVAPATASTSGTSSASGASVSSEAGTKKAPVGSWHQACKETTAHVQHEPSPDAATLTARARTARGFFGVDPSIDDEGRRVLLPDEQNGVERAVGLLARHVRTCPSRCCARTRTTTSSRFPEGLQRASEAVQRLVRDRVVLADLVGDDHIAHGPHR